jgi:hypothetical protein
VNTWEEMTATIRPPRGSKDGPLPPLLLLLTVVTGLVDATSYLKLGHVFVANMTGNVVFLGFGIAGAGGISAWASLTAVGSFLVGGIVGGRIAARSATDRARHLSVASATQLLFVTGALVIAALASDHLGTGSRYALIVLLAIAMGIQNAAARRLAVPDLTTTVLTMTLTGVAADAPLAGGHGSRPVGNRRVWRPSDGLGRGTSLRRGGERRRAADGPRDRACGGGGARSAHFGFSLLLVSVRPARG